MNVADFWSSLEIGRILDSIPKEIRDITESMLKSMPDGKLRRYFNAASESMYLEQGMFQLALARGEVPTVPQVSSLQEFGETLLILREGARRGMKPSQRIQKRTERKLLMYAKEAGATWIGKLVSIDRT